MLQEVIPVPTVRRPYSILVVLAALLARIAAPDE
jgi:hypothetical protein